MALFGTVFLAAVAERSEVSRQNVRGVRDSSDRTRDYDRKIELHCGFLLPRPWSHSSATRTARPQTTVPNRANVGSRR